MIDLENIDKVLSLIEKIGFIEKSRNEYKTLDNKYNILIQDDYSKVIFLGIYIPILAEYKPSYFIHNNFLLPAIKFNINEDYNKFFIFLSVEFKHKFRKIKIENLDYNI